MYLIHLFRLHQSSVWPEAMQIFFLTDAHQDPCIRTINNIGFYTSLSTQKHRVSIYFGFTDRTQMASNDSDSTRQFQVSYRMLQL